jgi:hypothetical protein
MDEPAPQIASCDDAVRAYERLLQTYLDRRPSGTRQEIALALGKHKSFISQIANPPTRRRSRRATLARSSRSAISRPRSAQRFLPPAAWRTRDAVRSRRSSRRPGATT